MAIKDRLHKGWIRLWIVSSLIITAVAFVLVYPSTGNQRYWQSTGYSWDQVKTQGQERAVLEEFFSAPYLQPRMRKCQDKAYLSPLNWNVSTSMMVVMCPRTMLEKTFEPLLISSLISAALFLLGLIASWIRDGFRK